LKTSKLNHSVCRFLDLLNNTNKYTVFKMRLNNLNRKDR